MTYCVWVFIADFVKSVYNIYFEEKNSNFFLTNKYFCDTINVYFSNAMKGISNSQEPFRESAAGVSRQDARVNLLPEQSPEGRKAV